jgi:transposase
MNEHAVGIDVSKDKLDICVAYGEKVTTKVVPNSAAGHRALLRWLSARRLPAGAPVVLEATGPYSEAPALALADAGWLVSIVNPARVKGFAQSQLTRNKTDKADARLLARFAQRNELTPWQAPSPAARELRALVERLQALQSMRQQEHNRLEALTQSTSFKIIDMVQEHIRWLERQIAQIEKDIHDHIDGHPQLKQDAQLIRSIPGCGPKFTAQFLAYIGNARRFKSAKALAAFIGVTPRQRLSGTSGKGRTMLSRTGHSAARRALYMPGLVAKRYNPVLRAMAIRLQGRGLAPKAIVGACMRRLIHLIYGVLKSGQAFNPQIPLRALAIQDGI